MQSLERLYGKKPHKKGQKEDREGDPELRKLMQEATEKVDKENLMRKIREMHKTLKKVEGLDSSGGSSIGKSLKTETQSLLDVFKRSLTNTIIANSFGKENDDNQPEDP